MREIKFRVYCKKHQKTEYYSLGDLVCGSTTESNDEGDFDGGTWSQFTGLKDKNGKEIYEGDIVSREVYWYRDIFDKYTLGFVDTEVILDGFWIGFIIYTNKYGFSIKKVVQIDNHDDTRTKIKGSVKIVQCKTVIIGNIHDNPELLNE